MMIQNPGHGKRSPSKRSALVITWFLALFMLLNWPVVTPACRVCFLVPQKTFADCLIESEIVVLARENPDTPFSYKVIKTLKGEPGNNHIDIFVDSVTRRRLRLNKDHAALIVRKNGSGDWQKLAIANPDIQALANRILARSVEWKGKDGIEKRTRFFVSLFDHENRDIFELAYLELGRAPYRTIKRIAKWIPNERIESIIQNRQYYRWRPLAILILAQKPSTQDRKTIIRSFDNCRKFGLSTNLAAWATAYVELEGANAIAVIRREYFQDNQRTDEEIRAVLTALSVHGQSGHTHLRNQIVACYGHLLKTRPHFAGAIAGDLHDWKNKTLKSTIAFIVANKTQKFDPAGAAAIRKYLK